MDTILVGLIYALGPVLLLYICKKYDWLNQFGAVALAYVLGIVLANIGLVRPAMKPMQDNFTSVTIALALPLLLFSINLKQWWRLAMKTGLAVVFGIVSVLAVVTIGHFIFRDKIEDCWTVSGLMVGVYIGGTANMAAIMKALGGDPNAFILVNAYDILICIGYFFFLVTKAQHVIGMFLPVFQRAAPEMESAPAVDDFDGWDAYRGIHRKGVLLPLLIALLLSGSVVGVALLLEPLFPPDYRMAGIILCITFLSILLSLVPWVNRIQKTFQSGMYLIVVFCIVVGSLADFSMMTLQSIYLAMFIVTVIVGSLVLQVLFSRLFKIDTDTTIITSTAFIFSAPFVPTVASALKNKEIILSGVTIGIIGYATGNFFGILLAYFLRQWG